MAKPLKCSDGPTLAHCSKQAIGESRAGGGLAALGVVVPEAEEVTDVGASGDKPDHCARSWQFVIASGLAGFDADINLKLQGVKYGVELN